MRYIFRYNIPLQNEVLSFYENEKDLNILSNKFNIPKKNIAEFLKIKNVFIKGQYGGARKHIVNKYYFDDINTEEKAYFLGLLYADGSNRLNRGEVNLTLKNEDIYLLKKLNDIINPTRPISKVSDNISRMYINSKYISNKLNQLGVFENKTFKIKFPYFLNENLYSHFIRGYFDGDGSISLRKDNKGIFYLIGTEDIIKSILEILMKFANINQVKINLNHNNIENNIRCISIGGNLKILKIYHYLYDNATIFMERKKNKFEIIKKQYEHI